MKWYTYVVSNQATENQLQALANQKNVAGLLAISKFYLERGDYAQAQTSLDQVKLKLKIKYLFH